MTVLKLTDVHRAYERGVPVLQGVDLSLDAGEVVGLLGPNGAGKTTLMRVAMGMILPQRGSARLFGADPSRDPVEAKRRVGYVSENQELPPFLRARDVLAMHAELFDRWDPKIAKDLMDRFRLTGKEKIRQLSKGQARRVAVVCAIAHRPELLLLDEPAGGLDPAGRREFLEVALKVLGSEGSAILFSSHQMDDVERIAGRVVMLRGGHKLIDRGLDNLREGTSLVAVPGGDPALVEAFQGTTGCLGSRITGGETRGIFEGSPERVREALGARINGDARVGTTTLEDLFIEVAEGA